MATMRQTIKRSRAASRPSQKQQPTRHALAVLADLALERGDERRLLRRQPRRAVERQQNAVAHDDDAHVLQAHDDALVAREHASPALRGVGGVEHAQVGDGQAEALARAERAFVGRKIRAAAGAVNLEPRDAPARRGAVRGEPLGRSQRCRYAGAGAAAAQLGPRAPLSTRVCCLRPRRKPAATQA
jgi:hypothetical protein